MQSSDIRILAVRIPSRNTGRSDLLTAFDAFGDLKIEGEELGEKIFLRGKPKGVENGGVYSGVGVFKRVLARATLACDTTHGGRP